MIKYKIIVILSIFCCISISSSYALYTDSQTVNPKITQYNPDREYSVVTRPPSEATLHGNIDGVPVKVEVPDENSDIIRVTAFDGSSVDKVWYDYNISTKKISMNWSSGSRTYDPDKETDKYAYYSIIKIMEDLAKTSFAQAGIKYDMSTKQLTIDQETYVNKIDPSIKVETYTVGDVVNIKLAKGINIVTCQYDIASGIATIPKDITFASNYQFNYSGKVSVAGIKVQDGNIVDSTANIITLPFAVLFSIPHLADQLYTISKNINTQLQPMVRVEDPEIVDIDWQNKQKGLIMIKGKAKVDKSSKLSIYVNNNNLTDAITRVGEEWSVVNNSKPVANGENKVNAIIRRDDGCEAESGDVTVYKGFDGKPDLILLSPRDRQLFAHEAISQNQESIIQGVKIEGRTAMNCKIKIVIGKDNKTIASDSSGKFITNMDMRMFEKENTLEVTALGGSATVINKLIVGILKLNVACMSQAYTIRKGDFAFNLMALSSGITMFNLVPFTPDHAGIYVGNQKIAEARMKEGIKAVPISEWNNSGFYGATQVTKLIDDKTREKVVEKVMTMTDKGYQYDMPISVNRVDLLRFSLKGHYDGPGNNNKLYCSELAYWAWDETAKEGKFDDGVSLEALLYPDRGSSDIVNNSVLPAFLCQKTMEVRRIAK